MMYADLVMWFLGILIIAPMIVIAILSIIVCLMTKKLRGEEDDGKSEKPDNGTDV